ncbi:hypothetical protein BRETT_005021 [Brettanomyces bruxellensis]|uniref:Golgi apyrase n=1 Tax=Dekkera bruxellensis TaxID=5007 RepID=A0A871R876_DEKBR|nr:uncharacterized protein BRETT_005021 [Brettanomyces bruxellensis]QOU20365.1 hypothetical protein BRETT_005021 [Brettanomyces bruxellensis]
MGAISVQRKKNVSPKPKPVSSDFEKDHDSASASKEKIDKKKEKSKRKKSHKAGPSKDEDGTPYNYIVVLDAGSTGTRVYVYTYLDAGYMVKHELLSGGKAITGIEIAGNLPYVHQDSGYWSKKTRPGLSSFKKDIKKYGDSTEHLASRIGKKSLKKLLSRARKVVPKDQQYRTPIFLHATAGVRLLDASDQEALMSATCYYIKTHSNFYLPDCESHVRVIDGEEEGLYGWITLNYLLGKMRADEERQVGFLEMGGASTQMCFEPQENEIAEHEKSLMGLRLGTVGVTEPEMKFKVYSHSFLGYGLRQMHLDYLKMLIGQNSVSGEEGSDEKSTIQIEDPCAPGGYRTKVELESKKCKVVGSGNEEKCRELVYKAFAIKETTGEECSAEEQKEVSKCLLSENMPDFSFDYENFFGVSGYWDTISELLDLENEGKDPSKTEFQKYGKIYSYPEIEKEVSKVCSLNWEQLKDYRDEDEDELADLCFRSTYIVNLLHNGLGLRRDNSSDSFQVNDQINGVDFTWTLGRAVLYASDESVAQIQALKRDNKPESGYNRVGYYTSTNQSVFIRGSEPVGVALRPEYGFQGGSLLLEIVCVLLIFALMFLFLWKRIAVFKMIRTIVSWVRRHRSKKYVKLDENDTPFDVELQDLEDDEEGLAK